MVLLSSAEASGSASAPSLGAHRTAAAAAPLPPLATSLRATGGGVLKRLFGVMIGHILYNSRRHVRRDMHARTGSTAHALTRETLRHILCVQYNYASNEGTDGIPGPVVAATAGIAAAATAAPPAASDCSSDGRGSLRAGAS